MLDIEVAAAVAPGANIVVYFTPNTDQGFIDAIATAVHDTTNKPSVISISWGGPESSWTAQAMTALDAACQSAAALGITITVAAGDNGSTDGLTDGQNHVDFPRLQPPRPRLRWNQTRSQRLLHQLRGSSGTSSPTTKAQPEAASATSSRSPPGQANSNVPAPTNSAGGRGVPDVCGDADPSTGYIIRVDGKNMVIGGTSAVAPLWGRPSSP